MAAFGISSSYTKKLLLLLLVVVLVVVAQVEPRKLRDVKTDFTQALAVVETST